MQRVRGSKSGYYHWFKSGPIKRWNDNQKLSALITYIFKQSYQSYGAPGIKAELKATGFKVSRSRLARIMKANCLYAKRKRKFKATTESNHNYPIAHNLLDQCFKVDRANQVWVSDINYIQTRQGWNNRCYLIPTGVSNMPAIGLPVSSKNPLLF